MTAHLHWAPDLAGVRVGSQVEVTGEEAHHAVVVRRLRDGEPVLLTDGRGTMLTGVVEATSKRSFTVRAEQVQSHPEPVPALTVVQALPKGDRGELAVEVLTEIGVARIVPWAASRSVAVWRGERAAKSHAKWQATAREAAKQARRRWFPQVPELAQTDEVVGLIAAADVALVLHEDAVAALPDLRSGAAMPQQILLIVGPEGGVSEEELTAFVDAGATSVRLGAEVLRTSTAGLAASAALLAQTERWRGSTGDS
ncbi:16S rRNA (uracil(1498)-N(3))-methyltransferase [Nocardioides sp. Bht2]|uniref:16S rRNA (uracil(1498)-N(3))-methyltransferase n=1 Tax=Nocardioides sp. Bht2 TaxID=3392297 RepID=UPI0039B68B30